MDRKSKLACAVGCLALLAVLGCGDDDGAAAPDAGTSPDTGMVAPDARPAVDSGPPRDTGPADAAMPAADAGDVALDTADEALLVAISEVLAVFETRAADVWSDSEGVVFRLETMPLYFVRRDGEPGVEPNVRGYLVHHPSPPDGAVLLSDTPENLGQVYRYDGALEAFGEEYFDYGLDVGGVPTFAFQFGEPEDDVAFPTSPEFAQYFVHEGFHRHQIEEEEWPELPGFFAIDTPQYPMTEAFLALVLLEDAILETAILSPTLSAESAEAALRQLIAVREARRALPESTVDGVNAVEYDDAGENVEGTALYVELTYVAVASEGDFDVDFVAEYIGLTAEDLETREFALDHLAQGRTYGTGASLGHLLDVVDGDWRAAMATNRGPYDVALGLFAPATPEDAATLLAAAKTEHAFDATLVPAAAAIAALE